MFFKNIRNYTSINNFFKVKEKLKFHHKNLQNKKLLVRRLKNAKHFFIYITANTVNKRNRIYSCAIINIISILKMRQTFNCFRQVTIRNGNLNILFLKLNVYSLSA